MSIDLSRRTVVTGCAALAGTVALGGVGKALAGETSLLRPPGAQDEADFIEKCLKCNRCISVCPQTCLRNGLLEDGLLNMRTPIIDFHRGYCDFCGKCEDVCPSAAIYGIDEETNIIGYAVVDPELCIAWIRGGCDVCVDACIYEAIHLDGAGCPVVDVDKCNGCGRCEYICPTNSYRGYSGAKTRGINVVLTSVATQDSAKSNEGNGGKTNE